MRSALQEKRTSRDKMPRRKNAVAAKKITVDSENHGEVEVEAVVERVAAAPAPAPAVAVVQEPVAAELPAATESAAGSEQQPAATSRPTLEIPAEQPAVPVPQQLAAAAEATPAANEQSTESAADAAEDRGLGRGPPEKTLLQRLYDWLMT
jgi:hypothetical protein